MAKDGQGQMVGLQPIPEALALREGQNQILEDSTGELVHGAGPVTLEFKIPGVQGQAFFLAYMNYHKEPLDPVVPVRVDSITLYRPRERGGRGEAVKLLAQGTPYVETIMGDGKQTFMLFALEAVEPKSVVEIEVENVDPAADLDDFSVVLWGELRDVREK